MEQEKIYAVAIRYNGKVYAMRPPCRHHNIIEMINLQTGEYNNSQGEQGFITFDGRFVCREEAAKIAIESGQIEKTNFQPNKLFSEDLW